MESAIFSRSFASFKIKREKPTNPRSDNSVRERSLNQRSRTCLQNFEKFEKGRLASLQRVLQLCFCEIIRHSDEQNKCTREENGN